MGDHKVDVGQSFDLDTFEDEYKRKFNVSLLEKSITTGNVSYSVLNITPNDIQNTDGVDYAVTDAAIDHTPANGNGYDYVNYSIPTGKDVTDSIVEQKEEM